MPQISIEGIGQVNLYLGLVLEIIISIILGGLIGLDRERKMKSAGIKTNILICLGATLYTAISLINYQSLADSQVDPNRMAAQVVSGIGFLGAGAIIHSRGEIVGLTTAATIWIVAAVGVAIGSGYPFVATLFVFTILFVLRLLDPLYLALAMDRQYSIEVLSRGTILKKMHQFAYSDLVNILYEEEVVVDGVKDMRVLYLEVATYPKMLKQFISEVEDLIQVEKVHFHLLKVKKSQKREGGDEHAQKI